jgi:hypothetical protein
MRDAGLMIKNKITIKNIAIKNLQKIKIKKLK